MTRQSLFHYSKTSLEVIRPAVMLYVRFLLSLGNVEDVLHERRGGQPRDGAGRVAADWSHVRGRGLREACGPDALLSLALSGADSL